MPATAFVLRLASCVSRLTQPLLLTYPNPAGTGVDDAAALAVADGGFELVAAAAHILHFRQVDAYAAGAGRGLQAHVQRGGCEQGDATGAGIDVQVLERAEIAFHAHAARAGVDMQAAHGAQFLALDAAGAGIGLDAASNLFQRDAAGTRVGLDVADDVTERDAA